MVLVAAGSPLDWHDSKQYLEWVKMAGLEQFVHFYKKMATEKHPKWMEILRWGDELEGIMVEFDHENKRVKLMLESTEKLQQMKDLGNGAMFTLEFAEYMVECVPDKPYKGIINHLNTVESNMRNRRTLLNSILKPNQFYLWYPTFPLLGCPDSTIPHTEASPESNSESSMSVFISDQVIYSSHPRFRTLSKNIRKRRGSKVAINIPVFKDKHTPSPFNQPNIPDWDGGDARSAAMTDHVYGDAMAFGMGSCALQITFQAQSEQEACKLYDQLATLTPILMALSASAPIFNGYLVDDDVRWNIISQSVDDRTPVEREEKQTTTQQDKGENEHMKVPKSRYSSIDLYISEKHQCFNDIPVPTNEKIRQHMLKEGIPENIANHVAHLFIRDPLAIYKEMVTGQAAEPQNYLLHTNHFENINSTNWQSMRFKLPPPDSNIGWRVEFRSIDVQATEFENAAFAVFIVLLSRVILTYDLNLLIPMSKLEENFKNASKRNAVLEGKFWFVNSLKCEDGKCCYFLGNENAVGAEFFENGTEATVNHSSSGNVENGELLKKCCCDKMDINTIMNGKPTGECGFKGLIPMLQDYLNGMEDIDVLTRCSLSSYFSLLGKRASGELKTWASWMRQFVQSHPLYKQDSVVTPEMTYDLMWRYNQIITGEIEDQSVLFKLKNSSQLEVSKAQLKAQDRLDGCNCNDD
ncbi:glutamate--cysteine ligase catalytic subunit-like [Symsagittifera roscoffensis]|uniref:glutamate--cysteine ligase catalytic subunit-like n=1 Tax=Symsagittifera roscoffensis TaxID=84072 RepID=UPI00307C032F